MSKTILRANYSKTANELAIIFKFKPEVAYIYGNVSPEVIQAYKIADSKGKFVNQVIKKNHKLVRTVE